MQDDLLDPKFETYSDEKLAKYLLDTICGTVDTAGYTPLMLASKQGDFESTKLLVEASPATINWRMPNSGNTALYLAVGAAYMEVSNSSNRSKIPENFMKTIEILVENGADPSLENHSNVNVNMLLAEFNIVDLSVLIANKLMKTIIPDYSTKNDGQQFARNNINGLMIYRNSDGKVNITEINPKKQESTPSTSQHESSNTFKGRTNTNTLKNIIQSEIKQIEVAGPPKFVKILPKPNSIHFSTQEVKLGKLKHKMDAEPSDVITNVEKKIRLSPAIIKKYGTKGNTKNKSSPRNESKLANAKIGKVMTTAANKIKITNVKSLVAAKIPPGVAKVKRGGVLAKIQKTKPNSILKILPKDEVIHVKTETDDTSGNNADKPAIVILNNMLLTSNEDSKAGNESTIETVTGKSK